MNERKCLINYNYLEAIVLFFCISMFLNIGGQEISTYNYLNMARFVN